MAHQNHADNTQMIGTLLSVMQSKEGDDVLKLASYALRLYNPEVSIVNKIGLAFSAAWIYFFKLSPETKKSFLPKKKQSDGSKEKKFSLSKTLVNTFKNPDMLFFLSSFLRHAKSQEIATVLQNFQHLQSAIKSSKENLGDEFSISDQLQLFVQFYQKIPKRLKSDLINLSTEFLMSFSRSHHSLASDPQIQSLNIHQMNYLATDLEFVFFGKFNQNKFPLEEYRSLVVDALNMLYEHKKLFLTLLGEGLGNVFSLTTQDISTVSNFLEMKFANESADQRDMSRVFSLEFGIDFLRYALEDNALLYTKLKLALKPEEKIANYLIKNLDKAAKKSSKNLNGLSDEALRAQIIEEVKIILGKTDRIAQYLETIAQYLHSDRKDKSSILNIVRKELNGGKDSLLLKTILYQKEYVKKTHDIKTLRSRTTLRAGLTAVHALRKLNSFSKSTPPRLSE